MGILSKLFGERERSGSARHSGVELQHGALVHVFVFDSGPPREDEAKYRNSLVRSLLPESMAYADLPVSFFTDSSMPPEIGQRIPGKPGHATEYPFAWVKIGMECRGFIEGLKVGHEKYTFRSEEYESDRGNRGILYAFYLLGD